MPPPNTPVGNGFRRFWKNFREKFYRHCGPDPQSHNRNSKKWILKQVQDERYHVGRDCYPDSNCSFALQTVKDYSPFTSHFSQKIAFTLAEVLITLGIIGVVAALTMPALIANHQKQVVETKLKKFYSTINQAIQMSEIDNGEKKDFQAQFKSICDQAGSYVSQKCLEPIYDQYFKKYIKTIKTEYRNDIENSDWNGAYLLYLPDGSITAMTYRGLDYFFYLDEKALKNSIYGKNTFLFGFYPTGSTGLRRDHFLNKGVEPYIKDNWDGTRDGLKNDVKNSAKLIQLNNWKIPDDYPFWNNKNQSNNSTETTD